ncbi:hypothetical protein TSUD_129030 [Trifolium subterraneum]|uniref:NB-ARC domain-containing protein n=1 Tax=Trifolium subterraneum TaxID=3900 RepID=A0A2Z6PCL4_TRISU|nr:hypothetical protein TSUD_129030 [Trifolium subterraneum]
MCDACCSCVISCARENLLPLARKHLFPIALDHLLPILNEAVNMIRGIPNDVIAHMKNELETIEEFIHQADKMVDTEGDDQSHGTREKIKQLIEAFFRMQDNIDEYIIREEQQLPDPGCAAGASDYVKTKFLRLQIAHDIQNIKSQINEMKDTSTEKDHGVQIKPSSSEQGSSSSGVNPNDMLLKNLRKAPFYMKEADIVGFEEPKNLLIDWLVNGRAERTVVSVVAMGGQGKTTLAKQVFDNPKVVQHFDCRVWITVSQQYNAIGLLKDMLHKLYNQKGSQHINQMDQDSLVDEVRNCLQQKRYVVVFDDVWNIRFWDEIDFAMTDIKNGSKIIITTRNKDVVNACKKSAFVDLFELKGLNDEQSLELFNKKAFHNSKGCCPGNLVDISSKIVKKCDGLPLAIVVTGGLLSGKNRNAIEWDKFNENFKPNLKKDSMINKFLVVSYHDLSYNLKVLKVFDVELAGEIKVPDDLGSLNHLKYFSIQATEYGTAVPKSIGMLENLETLDLTVTPIFNFPKEICKLRKLQHFLGDKLNLVQLKDGIGGMTSLQTLHMVCLNKNDEDRELIEELGKLKQLKKLGLRRVMRKLMSVLSSSINKMHKMEYLSIESDKDIIDLDLNLPKLQYLVLEGQLEKLPKWIPKHQNLVHLYLVSSKLAEDPMKLLKSMPNLLSISLHIDAYVGALPSLEKFNIVLASRLHRLPTGIHHLKKLEVLHIQLGSAELIENILLNGGKDHGIFKQVPSVKISSRNGKSIFN